MNKEEYIEWKESRSEYVGNWDIQYCKEADRLLEETTMKNFVKYLDGLEIPEVLKNWIILSAGLSFGSVEVDQMMQELGCYPSWI